jgi:hypothetical protein
MRIRIVTEGASRRASRFPNRALNIISTEMLDNVLTNVA